MVAIKIKKQATAKNDNDLQFAKTAPQYGPGA